jgi:hypothetical protein
LWPIQANSKLLRRFSPVVSNSGEKKTTESWECPKQHKKRTLAAMYRIRHWLAQVFFVFGATCLLVIFFDPGDWLAAIGSALFFWLLMWVVAPKR